jgi:hypothetical protein
MVNVSDGLAERSLSKLPFVEHHKGVHVVAMGLDESGRSVSGA